MEIKETGSLPIPVTAIKAHLAINVRNVEESIQFYRKLFGIEPIKVRMGYAKFDVQNPPLNFTLNEGNVSDRGALSHLGVQVRTTQDVLATKKRWHDAGLVTKDEMQTSCCCAVQDKTWVRDPDGNEWEVFAVLEDNLPEADAGTCVDKVGPVTEASAGAETASSCCAAAPVSIAK